MTVLWIEGKAEVPHISNKKLKRMRTIVKPIVRDENGHLHRIKPCHPKNVAFTWEPKLQDEVAVKEIGRIKTHHYCAYYGFFKPSIAEVLAQIPKEMLPLVRFFEVLSDTDSGTQDQVHCFRSGNGHLATTILYAAA